MLVRNRKSRIYFLRKFFDYPISLSADTIRKLGLARTGAIGASYLRRVLFPLKEQKNLEQFFINRFGDKLYRTFFKSYTEKVWGVPCTEIDAEWGAQRIKELSIWKSVKHFVKKSLSRKPAGIAQRETETSLIERFLYPKYGPGQMWEEVARKVREMGGSIVMEQSVRQIEARENRVAAVVADRRSGPAIPLRRGFCFLHHAHPASGALFADRRARQCARSQRGPDVPRFPHRGTAPRGFEDQGRDQAGP